MTKRQLIPLTQMEIVGGSETASIKHATLVLEREYVDAGHGQSIPGMMSWKIITSQGIPFTLQMLQAVSPSSLESTQASALLQGSEEGILNSKEQVL